MHLMPPDVPVICLSKGIETGSLLFMSEVLEEVLGVRAVAAAAVSSSVVRRACKADHRASRIWHRRQARGVGAHCALHAPEVSAAVEDHHAEVGILLLHATEHPGHVHRAVRQLAVLLGLLEAQQVVFVLELAAVAGEVEECDVAWRKLVVKCIDCAAERAEIRSVQDQGGLEAHALQQRVHVSAVVGRVSEWRPLVGAAGDHEGFARRRGGDCARSRAVARLVASVRRRA